MKNLSYKGYDGSIEYDAESKCLYGKVLGISHLIMYQSTYASELEEKFKEAIDDYLYDCKIDGINPEKPFKGSFNVRVTPETHREIFLQCAILNVSINKFVSMAIEKSLSDLLLRGNMNNSVSTINPKP